MKTSKMLPIVLVIFVATSAFAAPSVSLDLKYENEIPRNTLTSRARKILDGGDTNVYILTAEEILNDMSKSKGSQAQAYGQALALLGELSTGRPGDACAAANLINSYSAGNPGVIRRALGGYVKQLSSNIDNIVRLAINPESVRYATGAQGGCAGEGRTYQFEAAWNRVLASASPSQVSLINEEYCTAKRLYYAFNARSNNAGAHFTASALPPVVQIFEAASEALSNLLNVLASGRNPSQAGKAAKQALINGLDRVRM